METITEDAIRRMGEMVDMLSPDSTGDIHTVTATLNGATGGMTVRVETALSSDIVFNVS